MKNRCVIFDLDGTLIDSREDIANAVNATRRDFNLPPLSLETVVSYVGDGVRKLIYRSFAGTDADLEEAIRVMGRHYADGTLPDDFPSFRAGRFFLRDHRRQFRFSAETRSRGSVSYFEGIRIGCLAVLVLRRQSYGYECREERRYEKRLCRVRLRHARRCGI